MLTFNLQFSEEDMVAFFRSQGIEVVDVTFNRYIPVYHNRTETESFTLKCIVNPHNRHTVPVSVAFEKVVLAQAKIMLLAGISKIDVLNSLKTNKNGH
jgi:hypothetical protein